MAAPQKDGIDYFPLDCNFFEDKAIKGARAKFGNDGVVVYLYLLCIIYRDRGYFIEYDEDLILDVADTLHIDTEKVKSIIEHMINRSLFDENLAEKYEVLTSKAIQSRYQFGKRRSSFKRRVIVSKGYWLLEKEETSPWIGFQGLCEPPYSEEHILPPKSENEKTAENCPEPKAKEKAAKNGKKPAEDPKKNYADKVELTEKEYGKLRSEYPEQFVNKCIEMLNNYKFASGKKYKSDYYAILSWVVGRVQKEYPQLSNAQKAPINSEELFANPWGEANE